MPRVTSGSSRASPTCSACRRPSWPTTSSRSRTFAELGYEVAHNGDGRWNGVAIASKVGLDDVTRGFGTADEEHGRRFVSAECGGPRVFSRLRPERALP